MNEKTRCLRCAISNKTFKSIVYIEKIRIGKANPISWEGKWYICDTLRQFEVYSNFMNFTNCLLLHIFIPG